MRRCTSLSCWGRGLPLCSLERCPWSTAEPRSPTTGCQKAGFVRARAWDAPEIPCGVRFCDMADTGHSPNSLHAPAALDDHHPASCLAQSLAKCCAEIMSIVRSQPPRTTVCLSRWDTTGPEPLSLCRFIGDNMLLNTTGSTSAQGRGCRPSAALLRSGGATRRRCSSSHSLDR